MSRCSGHCCREIRLGWSPGQIELGAAAERKGDTYYIFHNNAYTTIGDSVKLHEMLIPVRLEDDGRWLYHCRHLQPNGDCADYENRPWMCRAFPYGRPCPYEGCSWDEGRHGEASSTP